MDVRRILVVRNDKLGDFMLAWPAIRLLKEQLPETAIHALVPRYTQPMAELCPWLDGTVIDQQKGALRLARDLRAGGFDAVVTLFSTTRVALAVWLAGIPLRLAPATKWAQLFYSHRLTQRRSRSEKPEFRYNLDVARHFLHLLGREADAEPLPPFLEFPAERVAQVRQGLLSQFHDSVPERLVFVHPGSGGSAVNLDHVQYAALCQKLHSARRLGLVITAGPGEEGRAEELAAALHGQAHVVLKPDGLPALAQALSAADLFLSGSTGPLHIAGALNRPTAAFYPSHRSATPLRWQTLNEEGRRLAFSPPQGAGETNMSAIDIDAAASAISERFLR
jgi:ADP-heptose:LPS heptosyltransferase